MNLWEVLEDYLPVDTSTNLLVAFATAMIVIIPIALTY